MSDQTKIEWSDATWNPVTGCTKVSPGCRHCYAENWDRRFNGNHVPWTVKAKRETAHRQRAVNLHPDRLQQPLHWRKPRRVFVCSMSDLFHEDVPFDFIDLVLAVAALCPEHTFQWLTKRPARMLEYFSQPDLGMRIRNLHALAPDWARRGANSNRVTLPLDNLWLGVSVENQRYADERIPLLLRTPAAVRWLSMEPLLGPVDLAASFPCGYYCDPWPEGGGHHEHAFRTLGRPTGIDWIVVGGESGPGARPMHPEWAQVIRDQCLATRIAFFFKQWGEWTPGVNVDRTKGTVATATWFDGRWVYDREDLAWQDGHIDDEPDLYRVGKQAAGAMLDGREWREFPG